MSWLIIWKTAFSSILKNKRRSLLTMVGIVIGIASVITIVAIGNGFKEDMVNKLSSQKQDKNVKRVSFNAFSTADIFSDTEMMTENDLSLARLVEGVKSATFDKQKVDGRLTGNLTFKSGVKNLSINYEIIKQTKVDLVEGRQLNRNDDTTLNKVIVIDEEVAKALYQSSKYALNKPFTYKDQVFTIVGVAKNTSGAIGPGNDNSLVYFPEKTYEHYFGKLKDAGIITLSVLPNYDSNQVMEKVIKSLSEQGTMRSKGTYQEYDIKDAIKELGSLLNNLILFISTVAGISLIIAGIGVMNMMYISVSERIKEIGIRRALGGSASDIKKQFLIEGFALTLIGGISGYLLGMVIAKVISFVLPFNVHPDLMTISIAIGVSSLIGIVFSYFPASSAAKKDLIDIIK